MSGTSVACSDVDECDTGTDNCDINAVCLNTRAGFTRELNDGHSGKGDFCNDIHECLDSVCDSNAAFANNDGSYVCVCNTGYQMMVSHALTMMLVTLETTTVILMLYVSTLQVHIHVIV